MTDFVYVSQAFRTTHLETVAHGSRVSEQFLICVSVKRKDKHSMYSLYKTQYFTCQMLCAAFPGKLVATVERLDTK